MTDRSRFIPLFILSAVITICPAMALFSISVSPMSSAPAWGSLLATMLITAGLLTIFAISGLPGDLIRGITEQTNGRRNISVLATIGGGILAGVLAAVAIGWLATLLPTD